MFSTCETPFAEGANAWGVRDVSCGLIHVQHLRDPFFFDITAKRKQGGFVILTASGINEFVNIFCCNHFIFPGKHMRLTVIYYHPAMILINAVIIVTKLY